MVEIGVLINQVGENLERNSNSKKEKDDISAYGTTAPGDLLGCSARLGSVLGTLSFRSQQSMGVCRVLNFQALLI